MRGSGNVSKQKKQQLKIGFVVLAIVVLLYLAAAFLSPAKARIAFESSAGIMGLIIPILLLVTLLMALINRYLNPKKLSAHLGEESGPKGWMIAVTAGVLSHGPGYIWYPMLSDLRSHGVHNGLIVAFIYARSIKLPWLAVLASYFGILFTLFLVTFTLLGAIIQGMIARKLLRKSS
ncbi:MAG TPA: permease [Epsilonproteobacteria bacterium]|nr:permease [Campylobacterota bacterium]